MDVVDVLADVVDAVNVVNVVDVADVLGRVLGKSSVVSAAMSVAKNNTILWSLDRQYYYLSDDHASSM